MCHLYLYTVLKNVHFMDVMLLLTAGCVAPFLWTFADFLVEEGFPVRRYGTYVCVLLAIYILLPDPAVYIKMCNFN